jgi:sec-independent protein translocase protein TatC
LAITVFTALATPAADVVSMFLLAIPMVGLYFLATAISMLNDKRFAKREAAMNAEYGIRVDE